MCNSDVIEKLLSEFRKPGGAQIRAIAQDLDPHHVVALEKKLSEPMHSHQSIPSYQSIEKTVTTP